MKSYWCELAWLGGEAPVAGVQIETDAGLISSVVALEGPTAADAVRLRGLTLPGLANAHSHAFQRALRGRTQAASRGSFWTWREAMYALAQGLDDDRIERIARATFGEMALAGITLVGEFDYLHRSDAILAAAEAAGVRLTLLDACYLEGGLERFRDVSARAWAERVRAIRPDAARARVGAAIHSVRAVDPESAREVAAVAAEEGWPLHAHVSEQPAENEECLRRYGLTPIQVLERAGALSPRFTAVHATHFADADASLLSNAEGFTCLCPTTERDLADGIGRPHGRLTLGSDSQAVIDIFEEMRAVELDERLRSRIRGVYGPADLLRGGTEHGYASLGWPEGGRLVAGALADFMTVSLDGIRLAGTRPADAVASVVFAASAADITHVVVGGRELVRDGRHVTLDAPGEMASAISLGGFAGAKPPGVQ